MEFSPSSEKPSLQYRLLWPTIHRHSLGRSPLFDQRAPLFHWRKTSLARHNQLFGSCLGRWRSGRPLRISRFHSPPRSRQNRPLESLHRRWDHLHFTGTQHRTSTRHRLRFWPLGDRRPLQFARKFSRRPDLATPPHPPRSRLPIDCLDGLPLSDRRCHESLVLHRRNQLGRTNHPSPSPPHLGPRTSTRARHFTHKSPRNHQRLSPLASPPLSHWCGDPLGDHLGSFRTLSFLRPRLPPLFAGELPTPPMIGTTHKTLRHITLPQPIGHQ